MPPAIRPGVTAALSVIALLAGASVLDGRIRPGPARRVRGAAGSWLTGWLMLAAFGLLLALCGDPALAAALALALLALTVAISNAKHAMLGEPLLFSDLALVGALARHPRFYLSAVRPWRYGVAAALAVAAGAALARLFVPGPGPHLMGIAVLGGALAAIAVSCRAAPWRDLARVPDAAADVARHGLLPAILLYWLRWRATRDPPPCAAPRGGHPGSVGAPPPEIVVIVQCESFADPADLFGAGAPALPALAAARAAAWQWGALAVGGFGAYTMRTEYGVLFGRDEASLGFRRYDPYLTALGETSYALPARLRAAGWRGVFLHPHDLRFYRRDAIMPAAGFAEVIGQEGFAAPGAGKGRYVPDAAVAEAIVARAAAARAAGAPSLIYAVTMENHGPWGGGGAGMAGYLRLARNGDAMLATLTAWLTALPRPALLVFFGDHRPSIPGVTAPGGDRHTPYVMLRGDGAGALVTGGNRRVDLTPAALHHAVLDLVLGPVPGGT